MARKRFETSSFARTTRLTSFQATSLNVTVDPPPTNSAIEPYDGESSGSGPPAPGTGRTVFSHRLIRMGFHSPVFSATFAAATAALPVGGLPIRSRVVSCPRAVRVRRYDDEVAVG